MIGWVTVVVVVVVPGITSCSPNMVLDTKIHEIQTMRFIYSLNFHTFFLSVIRNLPTLSCVWVMRAADGLTGLRRVAMMGVGVFGAASATRERGQQAMNDRVGDRDTHCLSAHSPKSSILVLVLFEG